MKKAKEVMIDKIVDAIKNFGAQVRANENLSLSEQIAQVDVLLDTIKFLDNYEENVKVLNEHHQKTDRRWKSR